MSKHQKPHWGDSTKVVCRNTSERHRQNYGTGVTRNGITSDRRRRGGDTVKRRTRDSERPCMKLKIYLHRKVRRCGERDTCDSLNSGTRPTVPNGGTVGLPTGLGVKSGKLGFHPTDSLDSVRRPPSLYSTVSLHSRCQDTRGTRGGNFGKTEVSGL